MFMMLAYAILAFVCGCLFYPDSKTAALGFTLVMLLIASFSPAIGALFFMAGAVIVCFAVAFYYLMK